MSLNDAEMTTQELLLRELEEYVPVGVYEMMERGLDVYVVVEND